MAIEKREFVKSTYITKIEGDITNGLDIYLNDINVFPAPTKTNAKYHGTSHRRYRKIFTATGDWAWYSSIDYTNGSIRIGEPGVISGLYAITDGFLDSLAGLLRLFDAF